MSRADGRAANQLRPVRITRGYTSHAAGSVLIEYGTTRVLCTVCVEAGVPPFMRGSGNGWITAEYGMLPGATHTRGDREAARGKQSGRTQEIQRLIGRALRTVVDRRALGETTLRVDCDVLQADGGTRTASVTGACVALVDALATLDAGKRSAFRHLVAAVSVGMHASGALLDLDYREDSSAETDMNVVMTEDGRFIEVQGTSEGEPFHGEHLDAMLALARGGISDLIRHQRQALGWA